MKIIESYKAIKSSASESLADFTKRFQSHILSIYRIFSIVILSAVVLGIVGYVSLLVFYMFNSSWATPIILSPTQEMVLNFQPSIANLESQLSQQEVNLLTLKLSQDSRKVQIESQRKLLNQMLHARKSQSDYLQGRGRALSEIESERTLDASRLRSLRQEAEYELKQIRDEEQAGLLTKFDAGRERASAIQRIAEITNAKESLYQAMDSRREAQNLEDTFRGGQSSLVGLNTIQQEVQLKANLSQSEIEYKSANMSIQSLTDSITGTRRILNLAKDSPKFKALREAVTVAFVPYSNLDGIEVGTPVYTCYLAVILCYQVGSVKQVYAAEENGVHPIFRSNLRGKMVGIDFTKQDASKGSVIFVGSKPFWI